MKRLLIRQGLVVGLLLGSYSLTGVGREGSPRVIDLSLLVSPELPCTAPVGWPYFQINPYLRIGPLSAYNSEILTIDPHTATQLDVPAHSVPRPDSKLPNSGPLGLMFTDAVPAWQFVGEACVIDVRELLDQAPNGRSPIITQNHIIAWERQHRQLKLGDVALFFSGFSDRYYKPFPAGRRFFADPFEGKTPAWPDPDPEAMEYLAKKGVKAAGTDSPSMGPVPDLGDATHLAGLKHGMIWTEAATGLGQLPPTGALYCMLGPKHARDVGSEARAFAIVGEPLTEQLIDSVRKQRVLDLSMTLSLDLPVSWAGRGAGNHRQPYAVANFRFNPSMDLYFDTHIMDSHTGTHLVPPAYALPPEGFDNREYSDEVRGWLTEYESRYGRRGYSSVTVERVPLSQTFGRLRIMDVSPLIGSTGNKAWPASPEITTAHLQEFEKQHGALMSDDIVIFRSGYSDQHCQNPSEKNQCMSDALNGLREGWPAPGPELILYLARRGIRCLATDGPTLGGTNAKKALMTYWAMGSQAMVGVEYLTNLGKLPDKAYFLFAAVKIAGSHGGPGRAIAIY